MRASLRSSGLSLLLLAAALVMPVSADAEPAGSAPPRFFSGLISAGGSHTCVILDATFADWQTLCWGNGADGRLGYGNTDTVGDDEEPQDYGPVQFGSGRTARAITTGGGHSCAILDDASVSCWGRNTYGQLGYGNTDPVGDDETPAATGAVDLGLGRTALAIAAGAEHTCALLDNGKVRCWGANDRGQIGTGNPNTIGDDETPGSATPVNLGTGRTAVAIATGNYNTCALLDNGAVRCWGYGQYGAPGYAGTTSIGDDESPASVGPVDLGVNRTAVAIDMGFGNTCVILDNSKVRCWGNNGQGQLGLGNLDDVGDDETPGSVPVVDLGTGRTARAISVGSSHTCVLLDNLTVRCWGLGASGRLGYGNAETIGDDEFPGSAGPVDLGVGLTPRAIAAGSGHTCVTFDDGSLKCWGRGTEGYLGYGTTTTIGDDETPAAVGPVNIGGTMFVIGEPTATLGLHPKTVTQRPVTFRASGQVRIPDRLPVAEACTGRVRITVTKGIQALSGVRDAVAVQNGRCAYSARFTFDAGQLGTATQLKVRARFLGNALLAPDAAPVRTLAI